MNSEDETMQTPVGNQAAGMAASLLPNETLGDYRILRLLGRGGMGEVYLAEHMRLGRHYALKLLPANLSREESFRRRFESEARTLAQMRHPNIVDIVHASEDSGRHYLVMEYVSGGSLDDYVRSCGGRLPDGEVKSLLRQLLQGLHYAHGQHIIHRDLKPANLLRTEDGTLKITDFGLARVVGEGFMHSLVEKSIQMSMGGLANAQTILGDSMKGSTLASTGDAAAYVGTIDFMSPEVRSGQPADIRSDIYAVGIITYLLLTGQKPLGVAEPPSRIVRGLSKRWDLFVTRALRINPDERFQTPADALAALEDVPVMRERADVPPRGGGLPPPRQAQAWYRRTPVLLGAGVALLAAALFAGALLLPTGPKEAVEQEGAASAPATPEAAIPSPGFVVNVDPPDPSARVWIGPYNAFPVENGKATLHGLPAGKQELIVQATGFQALTTHVDVGENGSGQVGVRLLPVLGTLVVQTEPGARVTAVSASGERIDLGETDAGGSLRVDDALRIGSYSIEISKKGRRNLEQRIDLEAGRETRVDAALDSLPGELRVFTAPQGAEISIDGVVKGRTSGTIQDVPTGRPVTVEVYLPGYRRQRQTLTLGPSEVRTLNLGTLAVEGGGLAVSLTPDSLARDSRVVLSVDDRPFPASWRDGALAADGLELGGRRIRVSHPDYQPAERNVSIRDNETARIQLALKPKPAQLGLESRPAGANVTFRSANSGNNLPLPRGPTPYTVELPPGDYVLRYQLQGYEAVERSLTVRPNEAIHQEVTLQRASGAREGKAWSVPDLGMELLWVEPGSFSMGSPSSEEGRDDDETQHLVTLTQGYWLGRTEVTQKQWASLMGSSIRSLRSKAGGTRGMVGEGDDYPVYYVSWDDAMQFCRKLTERERSAGRLPDGYVFTLPTEAQWEYACRAGSDGPFANDLNSNEWYIANSGNRSHPVGERGGNPWGFADMHGNVREWSLDWYGDYPQGGVSDPAGAPGGTYRVFRGGGWFSHPGRCRSAERNRSSADFRINTLGFRVCLAPGA